jgi:hypothetical protein
MVAKNERPLDITMSEVIDDDARVIWPFDYGVTEAATIMDDRHVMRMHFTNAAIRAPVYGRFRTAMKMDDLCPVIAAFNGFGMHVRRTVAALAIVMFSVSLVRRVDSAIVAGRVYSIALASLVRPTSIIHRVVSTTISRGVICIAIAIRVDCAGSVG